MPILPIDLQTLFTQMNQVGKEQAIMKDGTAVHNSMQGMAEVKNTELKDNSVNESQDIGDGIEKLKDEAKKQEQGEQKKKEEHEKEREQARQYFKDPDCGNNIDIVS